NRRLAKRGAGLLAESDLVEALSTAGRPESTAFHIQLLKWDRAEPAPWAEATASESTERREVVLRLLGLESEAAAMINDRFPTEVDRSIVISNPDWEPWYDEKRRAEHHFYWDAYRGVLERNGWDGAVINELDRATSEIVGRLADPTAQNAYQS